MDLVITRHIHVIKTDVYSKGHQNGWI